MTCKTATVRGDATYPGGYCTKACTTQTDCGGTNNCIGGATSSLQFYGETSAFCAAGCPSAGSISTCRTGYTCEFNATALPGVCWLDPIPTFNGGGQATNTGAACTTSSTCQNPPSALLGYCITATTSDGGVSGWTQGYCTANCAFDNTGAFCGANGTCITLGTAPNTSDVCLKTCPTAGSRTGCRSPGYSCFNVSGGTTNICYPDCSITGCTSPMTCNATTGACQ